MISRMMAFRVSLLLGALTAARVIAADSLPISHDPNQAGFKLVAARHAADLCLDGGDFKVVQIATDCLKQDVERVTGVRPQLKTGTQGLSEQAVLIGTIGKSALIDGLIQKGKLDARRITGKWESYLIATVTDPLPGVRTGQGISHGRDKI